MKNPAPSRPAAVYRLFDADGNLLYIGSAYNPGQRCKSHEAEEWWPKVASHTEEWHPTRGHAYMAEMGAIASEAPERNVMGSQEYRDTCRRRAHSDPAHRSRVMAGSAAGNGAPREIVEAILRGEIKSYRKGRAIYFD